MPPRQVWLFQLGCWVAFATAIVHLAEHVSGLNALPPETQILSQPARVAAAMVAYLFRHPEMKEFAPEPVEPLCFTTGDAEVVSALASRFYGRHLRFEAVDSGPRKSSETLLDA